MTDEELLEVYVKGFNDELKGTSTLEEEDNLWKKAYSLGASHAILGDEIKNIDNLSNQDILNLIKQ